MLKKLTANDGKMADIIDMKIFIMHCPPLEYKSTRKFLAVAFIKKQGWSFWCRQRTLAKTGKKWQKPKFA